MLKPSGMKRICSIIASISFVAAGIPWPAYAASNNVSVAVAPAMPSDSADSEAAAVITDVLARIPGVHVIDRGIVNQVVEYHAGEGGGTAERFGPAVEHLARAQDHYFNMRYDEARVECARTISLLDGDHATMHRKGQLTFDAVMTDAMISKAQGDEARMHAAIKRAAAIAMGYTIDRAAYPPSMAALFERAQARLTEGGAGEITVSSDPPVAAVYINGIRRGVTPLEMRGLPPGDMTVVIEANKYRSVERSVHVKPNGTSTVSAKLAWVGDGSNSTHGATGPYEIERALGVAELLKADRAVLVTAGGNRGDSGYMRVRVADRAYRAAFRPIEVRYDAGTRAQALADLTDELTTQIRHSVADDPARYADPRGTADPILLGKHKKRTYRQPLLWGAIGTAVAGALAGGLAAAFSGGSSDEGSVRVKFK